MSLGRRNRQVSEERWHEITYKHFEKDWSIKQITEWYDGYHSYSTICRIIQSYRDFGRYVSREEKTAKYDKRLLRDGDERLLLRIVNQSPWLYIDEFQKLLYRATGVKYSYNGIRRVFKRHGLTSTKLERMARSRCHIEVMHFNSVIQTYDPECLIFLDESHVDDRDCRRRRGWSGKGIKCYIREAFSRGNPVSVLAAFNTKGFVVDACSVVRAKGVNTDIFLDWVRDSLVPILNPWSPFQTRQNSVVVLDNASIHHSEAFMDLVTNTGARVVFLPPLSPHLNPIELGFNMMKRYLKRLNVPVGTPYIMEYLYKAMREAISDDTARNFYRHCRYDLETRSEIDQQHLVNSIRDRKRAMCMMLMMMQNT